MHYFLLLEKFNKLHIKRHQPFTHDLKYLILTFPYITEITLRAVMKKNSYEVTLRVTLRAVMK